MNINKFLISFAVFNIMSVFQIAGCDQLRSSDVSVDKQNARHIYDGWFLGVGLGWQYTKRAAELNDNMSTATQGILSDLCGYKTLDNHVGKVGASMIGGYGKFVTDNFYLGGELTVDVAGSDREESDELIRPVPEFGSKINCGKTSVETKGIVPTLAARIGWCAPEFNSMIYTKVGFTIVNSEFRNTEMYRHSGNQSDAYPIVGIGFEKSISSNYSMRLECDYRFTTNKPRTLSRMDSDEFVGSIRTKGHGYSVRLACAYHFN